MSHPSFYPSVQFSCSVVSNSLQPHGLQHARPPCPSPIPGVYSNSCPSVMPSSHLILCCPLLLSLSIFPSIRVFSNELVLCIRWPKYWSFSFSICPCNEYSGLISFRMDWLDLLAVQGTLKNLLQHHSSKASILPLGLSLVLCTMYYVQSTEFFFFFPFIFIGWRLITLQYCSGFCHTLT